MPDIKENVVDVEVEGQKKPAKPRNKKKNKYGAYVNAFESWRDIGIQPANLVRGDVEASMFKGNSNHVEF